MLGLLPVHLTLDHFALGAVQFRKAHSGIALQPFQVGAMQPLGLAVIFLEFFAARARNLPSQVADLPVKRAHDVHRLIHPIDQAFALEVG